MEGSSDTAPGSDTERAEAAADKDLEEIDETGYQPSVNQARDEPVPASHHDRRAERHQDGGREQRG
jgi:hypothetical protein